MSEPRVVYAPGEWVAMSRGDGWALIQLPLTDLRIRSLWESLVVSADQALDDLLSNGVRSLPGFAVLKMQDDGLRCAVRGPARVHAEAPGASQKYEGTSPWLDIVISPIPARVTVYGSDTSALVELPMLEGIVSAGHLAIELTPVTAGDAPGSSTDRGAGPTAAPVPIAMGAPTLHRAPEAGTPESLTVEPATTAPVEIEPEVTEAATASSPGRQSTYHKLLSLDTTDRRAFLSQLRAAEEAAADEEPAEEAVEPVVPWAGPVVADQPVADETGAASGSSDERPVAVLRETATNPDADRTTGPAAVTARVTDGVPWMTGASTTHTTGAPPGPPIPAAPAAPIKPEEPSPVDKPQPSLRPDDLSAVTTSRAALLRQMAEDVPSGPTVFAYRCSDGHLSPTTAVCCRVCGARLEEQPAIQVARPVLGKLTFSNGLTVLLDRSVIFGRDPRPFSDDPADRPNLIRPIESGELSRMHASVTIDGWQLVLRDLGSTHGTFLTLPGGTMRKLRAHEDYPLEPGSLVSLAEIVSFTYEPTA